MRQTQISIAMTSYNGQRFIKDQLSSILNQTLKPCEIVIVDDASRDETVQEILNFKEKSSVSIRLIRNPSNLGSTLSFEKAIQACKGEWIALSDQDDFWLPTKLEDLLDIANRNKLGAVFSDADLVNEKLQNMNIKLFDNSRLTKSMTKQFRSGNGVEALVRYNVVTGATLMFKAEFAKIIIPIPKLWVHDYWIALLISCVGTIGFHECALVKYRQHSNNQIGAKATLGKELKVAGTKNRDNYLEEAKRFSEAYDRLFSVLGSDNNKARFLKNKIEFLKSRYQIGKSPYWHLNGFLTNLFKMNYFKYGQGFRTLIKDLLIP